jgi:hypothetical protein
MFVRSEAGQQMPVFGLFGEEPRSRQETDAGATAATMPVAGTGSETGGTKYGKRNS